LTNDPARAERELADRSLAPLREQYETEVRALLDAAYRVLRRNGERGATVAEILAEAGLSTRAFYRHFRSKDELLLALFQAESEAAGERLDAKLAVAPSPRAGLDVWIDDVLDLVYERRRAERTFVFSDLPLQLALDPVDIDRVSEAQWRPLVGVLAAGLADGDFPEADPELDACIISEVCWTVVGGRPGREANRPPRAEARTRIMRYVLAGLGAER